MSSRKLLLLPFECNYYFEYYFTVRRQHFGQQVGQSAATNVAKEHSARKFIITIYPKQKLFHK